ncbi:MAG: baseplate protein, partial [Candidatus Accumulibacter sp.]|nr:baseplate protein [Accumulibacter sp.]
ELLLISIDYEVRATNNAFNLVYPFYLDRSTS